MISEDKLSYLLNSTKRILAHQRELKKQRGETFNVFSILKMERRENSTHSAFLAELLNPKGSHYKEDAFLKLFLQVIETDNLETKKVKVKPEHHVGLKDNKSKTGGRIDIYIWDEAGNSISIENKIDAGDQHAQIERYCNHNKERNKVYYLTLNGAEPSAGSRGGLEAGKDFFLISYRKHIIEWLDLCIKEAAEVPILRESIKQYKLLIQNITATMQGKDQQELTDLMIKYFKESEYVAANFIRVSTAIKERLRQSVLKKLKERLGDHHTIVSGHPAEKFYSQIWIKIKGMEEEPIFFGLESFSGNGQGHFGGALFIGTINLLDGENEYTRNNKFYKHRWYNAYVLNEYEHYEANLKHGDLLQKLNSDNSFRDKFENHIVEEVEQYLIKETEKVKDFLISIR
ncbi:PD-(D/E)XK nuclease family protein [Pontibacter sp. BT310]|uniref:PD-(D/E)XK nuclease family protein n=1 Tax=Pontibacter populi TaxID=890055 RepID=A0ABS6XBB0_9BACT|nr:MULTISPECIES: PD-(D/E)XK nuclease family protein [Pontibacter]MBJ6118091.1 PD-(D/E)XK nuclease family protein [Pontibacter sp. BT310]MBR0570518.1 PD-(D/E)XK nuclease family protein [Microvirga sp. STS03]MBW3364944.1 PD-(D/E)XK nuclease family protein [Pontibacter populi]